MTNLTLHVPETDTLFHAEDTFGEPTTGYIIYTMTDENSNDLTDENGNLLGFPVLETFMGLHAPETDTLLHAEDTT